MTRRVHERAAALRRLPPELLDPARAGASTKEVMARMGHDSAQAAMIYQHATSEADWAIAKAVDEAVKKARKSTKKAASRRPRNKAGDKAQPG
jgi:hypothetical protein